MINNLKNKARVYKYGGIAFFLVVIIAIVLNVNMNRENEFAIYLVRNPAAENLDDLILSESPLITDKEIAKYYWDEQIIQLKEEMSLELEIERKSKFDIKQINGKGIDFVVIAKGDRIYRGKFLSPLSSWYPFGYPTIRVLGKQESKDLHIHYGDEILDDKIKDHRIYKVFEKNKKLQQNR